MGFSEASAQASIGEMTKTVRQIKTRFATFGGHMAATCQYRFIETAGLFRCVRDDF
jgi:hypothetical protein